MKKIIKGAGSLLGIGGSKKKDAATPAAEQKGPIVTPLGPGVIPPNRRRSVGQPIANRQSTILGGNSKLGGY